MASLKLWCACGRQVSAILWTLTKSKRKLPTCSVCIAKEKLKEAGNE